MRSWPLISSRSTGQPADQRHCRQARRREVSGPGRRRRQLAASGEPLRPFTACRLRSRIFNRPSAFRSRVGPRSTRTRCRWRTPCSSSGCGSAGAIPIGKTNVPEFGMGRIPTTRCTARPQSVRPHQERRRFERRRRRGTCRRHAAHCRWQRLGGSFGNPGNFNNVVGMRPTVGLGSRRRPTCCRFWDSR